MIELFLHIFTDHLHQNMSVPPAMALRLLPAYRAYRHPVVSPG